MPTSNKTIIAADRPRLREIGLGAVEIHPMVGRCHRRPFGEDYFTITNNGLVEAWYDQLDYFEQVGETLTFGAIYQALRSLLRTEWGNYRRDRNLERVCASSDKPHLAKYRLGRHSLDDKQIYEDLRLLDDWAEKGFPPTLPVSEPVKADPRLFRPEDEPKPGFKALRCPDVPHHHAVACDINLSEVCNRQWVQNCETWATKGLPCHDSIFLVVSQLSRWFYFIEWWVFPRRPGWIVSSV